MLKDKIERLHFKAFADWTLSDFCVFTVLCILAGAGSIASMIYFILFFVAGISWHGFVVCAALGVFGIASICYIVELK